MRGLFGGAEGGCVECVRSLPKRKRDPGGWARDARQQGCRCRTGYLNKYGVFDARQEQKRAMDGCLEMAESELGRRRRRGWRGRGRTAVEGGRLKERAIRVPLATYAVQISRYLHGHPSDCSVAYVPHRSSRADQPSSISPSPELASIPPSPELASIRRLTPSCSVATKPASLLGHFESPASAPTEPYASTAAELPGQAMHAQGSDLDS